MRITLVFPKLPPSLDGIGDYTKNLAESLAQSETVVRVVTAQKQAVHIEGVEIVEGFSTDSASGIRELASAVSADLPDWLVLQYNPFSYGRWGFNLWLPEVVAQLKREHSNLRIAVMVHEPFVPVSGLKLTVMTVWQRWQLWRLGHVADLVLCAIEPWVQALRPYIAEGVPLIALPVGSNIPDAGFRREEARALLGVAPDEMIVGMFGSARRRLDLIRAALLELSGSTKFRVLYVGPDGPRVRKALEGISVDDLGPLPASKVSQALRAMDVHLAPYPRGVSARRGAFIAGLQHGLPSVSTVGSHTDPFLAQASDTAFVLTPEEDTSAFAAAVTTLVGNSARRRRMAAAASTFHERHFAWDRIASRLLHTLESISELCSPSLRSGLEQESPSYSP